MGYKPAVKKKYALAEIACCEVVKDSRGREWGIRVYPLCGLNRFQKALVSLLAEPGARTWARFLQAGLRAAEPGFGVRMRRAAGLPDFSARRIAREINMKDAALLRNRIVKANLDVEFGEFVARCGEIIKKKIAAENGSADGTGAKVDAGPMNCETKPEHAAQGMTGERSRQ